MLDKCGVENKMCIITGSKKGAWSTCVQLSLLNQGMQMVSVPVNEPTPTVKKKKILESTKWRSRTI